MNKFLSVILAVFGLIAGCFIGMGNHAGLLGAVLPGLIVGVLVAGPSIRERRWRIAGLLAVCGFVGCLSAVAFPDSNPVKRFCHEQTNLVIHVGSYQLGTESRIK